LSSGKPLCTCDRRWCMATASASASYSAERMGKGSRSYHQPLAVAVPYPAHPHPPPRGGTPEGAAMQGLQMHPVMLPASPYVSSPQPAFWAPAKAVYPTNLQELILNQVHYYFSTENLLRDEFLRNHMHPEEGWISIHLLSTFNRLRHLTTDVRLITETLKVSSELEVRDGKVRKRHDWQRWVKPPAAASTSQEAGGGDTRATDASSDEAADTAVETGSPPSPQVQSPKPQPVAEAPSANPQTWRDAATKQLSSTQVVALAPAKPAAASAPAAACVAAVSTASASTAHSTATPSDGSHRKAPPAINLDATSSQSSDEDGQSEVEPSLVGGGGGWETPSLKGKERRWRTRKGEKGKGEKGSSSVAVTDLSSADPSTALCSSGKAQLTDEQRSDETTVLFEEDRSSSLSEEAQPILPTAVELKPPTTRPPPAAPASSPTLRKRSTAASTKRAQDHKATDKSRSRGIKELNDAPPMDQQNPGLLASLDLQLVTSRAALCFGAAKQVLGRGHAVVAANTPRTQAFIRGHAHEARVQLAFALLVLLLLGAAQHASLPPTVGTLASTRWVEVPVGLMLAFKFNEIGSSLLALCSPPSFRHV